jgi:hypothetical protein
MPVAVLLVEGELDEQVLFAWKPPGLLLERGGGKSSLRPMARDRRNKVAKTYYLRDRDFDFDPPAELAMPTLEMGGLGWRWCRHEMESYLLEPRLVEQATGWGEPEYTSALQTAAQKIHYYTAARWAVGIARRTLPPFRELPTRPGSLSNEIKLPPDCSETVCDGWAQEQARLFLDQVTPVLGSDAIAATLAEKKQRLRSLSQPQELLLWHAGKDLLAALAPAMPGRFKNHPTIFVRELRDWVRANPELALDLFPEWRAFVALLTST